METAITALQPIERRIFNKVEITTPNYCAGASSSV
jgi:hypothetical protein